MQNPSTGGIGRAAFTTVMGMEMRKRLLIVVVLLVLIAICGTVWNVFHRKLCTQMANPLPLATDIGCIRLLAVGKTSRRGTKRALPQGLIVEFRSLFDAAQHDPNPKRWQTYAYLEIEEIGGIRHGMAVFSTHEELGAFSLDDAYFRGGSDEKLRELLDSTVSSQRPDTPEEPEDNKPDSPTPAPLIEPEDTDND